MGLIVTSYCHIFEKKVVVNDRLTFFQENFLNFADFIKSVYKKEEINYPRFYKMDSLSKLGFISSALVINEKPIAGYCSDAVGVVMSNSSSSLDTDIIHNDTIKDRAHFFPSPSVFVYTLPNIMIGEICIKNKINGENVFLISENFDEKLLVSYTSELFGNFGMEACLCGWVEVFGDRYQALTMLVEKETPTGMENAGSFTPFPFKDENLKQLIERN